MSRVNRIVIAALVSLGIIVGVFTSVEGASLVTSRDLLGSHTVSGAMVNLDHFRSVQPASVEMDQEFQSGKGHGCDSEQQTSPDD